MKKLTAITAALIAIGLLSTIVFVSHYSINCLTLVQVPYVVLFFLLNREAVINKSVASTIAVFITASVISFISAIAYYEVSFGNTHSSTEGLIFFILPVYAILSIPIIYFISKFFILLLKKFTYKDGIIENKRNQFFL